MEQNKVALITGITGQDGSYLTELLVSKGYTVHGIVRRHSLDGLPLGRFIKDHPSAQIFTHYGDLLNTEQITKMIYDIHPDEIYHLGAQSHVQVSFDTPEHTGNVVALGTTRLLEAIRGCGDPSIRFYNAATSEMFGNTLPPQSETTKFQPRSPYACAKAYGFWMTKNYRTGYQIHASSGILFNHESPRRGDNFVTRKITKGIANIIAKKQKVLKLGDISSKRDWGFAPEYVEAMWRIVQKENPDDYVIGTGESHTVREFIDVAFAYADLDPNKYVELDQTLVRPTDVPSLLANPKKAATSLKWSPKISIKDLAMIMVDAEFRAMGITPIGAGDETINKKFPNKWWYMD